MKDIIVGILLCTIFVAISYLLVQHFNYDLDSFLTGFQVGGVYGMLWAFYLSKGGK